LVILKILNYGLWWFFGEGGGGVVNSETGFELSGLELDLKLKLNLN